MGLEEHLEEMQKQLEEMQDTPDEVVEPKVVEEPEDKEPEAIEEPKETVQQPDEAKIEDKPDNAAMARMRRELAATQKQLRELTEGRQERPSNREPEAKHTASDDIEPNVDTNPVDWVKWNKRQTEKEMAEYRSWKNEIQQNTERQQLIQDAGREILQYESEFRKEVPDYDEVSKFMVDELSKSFKRLNPSLTPEQIMQSVQNHVLQESSRYAARGLNPVEEMYHVAKEEFGYAPKAREVEERQQKPDMTRVADNRRRSSGMAAAAGSPRTVTPGTREAAAQMSPAEWMALPESEKARFLGGY